MTKARFPVPTIPRITVFLILGYLGHWPTQGLSQNAPDFIREVRPILSNHCFKCHGPDEKSREAGLRLDTREGATQSLASQTTAIVPGHPERSELMKRIASGDEAHRMPPPESGPRLDAKARQILENWITAGANYTPHWAFRPIQKPALPTFEADHPRPGRSPLDFFVEARLRDQGLSPSPEADRTTLIRRLSLDLTGLPPTAQEVRDFLEEDATTAYSRLVDRLLARPGYGEKWGRHWLDHARYADTHGYTIDSERTMWPYRDWVIQAWNDDMGFDEFTRQQLAGDLLPSPTTDQMVATGFHRNTLINQEGGTDKEQFRNEATVDRVNTTGAVWLGLTVGCAQCHTHKYDPLTQKEYYQLFAFFNQAADENSVSPTVTVPSPDVEKRLKEAEAEVDRRKQALEHYNRSNLDKLPSSSLSVDWRPVDWLEVKSQAGSSFESLEDDSLLVGGPNGDSDVYELRATSDLKKITAIQLEAFTHPSLPKGGPGRAGNGNFVLNELQLLDGTGNPARWIHATADHSQKDYDVKGAIDGNPATGWAIGGISRANVQRTATFVLDPIETNADSPITLRLVFGDKPSGYNIGRFRIRVTEAPHALLNLPDPEKQRLQKELAEAEKARDGLAKSFPKSMVMQETNQRRPTHVLIRGDFLRHGDPVEPGTPGFLPGMKARPDKDLPDRLDLANWLVSRENPLTARVLVNRVWMQLFGIGLVETENDFGLQGTPPTHPELLDWLAVEFMEQGWSMKHLIRTIVLSATYRQSSDWTRETLEKDPRNHWLARQSRIRVQAETVRDLSLGSAGLLTPIVGGKSVYPPQPAGVYAFTQRNAGWPTSAGADRYRRGLYIFFMRSAPHPLFTTFDTPAFNTTCTSRPRSNTPLQALMQANDLAVLEAARHLGNQMARISTREEERIRNTFLRCLAREPSPTELQSSSEYLKSTRQSFENDTDSARSFSGTSQEPVESAAWTSLIRALMNLDEFLTRP